MRCGGFRYCPGFKEGRQRYLSPIWSLRSPSNAKNFRWRTLHNGAGLASALTPLFAFRQVHLVTGFSVRVACPADCRAGPFGRAGCECPVRFSQAQPDCCPFASGHILAADCADPVVCQSWTLYCSSRTPFLIGRSYAARDHHKV